MSASPTITFNSEENNRVTITASGGEDNQSYTMTYGGYENSFTFTSATKNGSYLGTTKEEVVLEEIRHILTNNSQHIEGIKETVANVVTEMVGDRHYQDADSAQAFVNNMSSHMAQRSSSGHNDAEFDLMSMIMPIDLNDLANKVSSVVEFPDDLEPMPSADSIWNLPKAVKTATSNQIKIEAATLQKQLSLITSAQSEMCDEQNKATAEEMEKSGDSASADMVKTLVGGLTGTVTPETKPKDSYNINDDMIYAGMQDWVENGGIDIEKNI